MVDMSHPAVLVVVIVFIVVVSMDKETPPSMFFIPPKSTTKCPTCTDHVTLTYIDHVMWRCHDADKKNPSFTLPCFAETC